MFWEAGSLAPGRAIRLLVYVDAAGAGLPSNATLVHTEDTTIRFLSPSSFNEYTLSSPVLVNSGEYYVGAFDLVADAVDTFIMSSDTDTASGRSYNQAESTAPGGYGLVGDRTWMMRAKASSFPPPGSVQLTSDEACNISTVPEQDYGVYEGDLTTLSGVPDHAPVACTTGTDRSLTLVPASGERFFLVTPVMANREGSLGTGTGVSDRTPTSSCQSIHPGPCP